jgi:crossover junction endodeoxyribonuclease RuvC
MTTSPYLRVVGIDPSLTATGIAWWGSPANVGCSTIGRPGLTKFDLAGRVRAIDQVVQAVLNEAGLADLYVIETPITSSHGMAASSGLVERNALWWLIVRRLIRAEQNVVTVVAPQLKLYATGKGNAPKTSVVDAVARRLPMFPTTGNDNMADAAVLCAMGCDHLGQPITDLPAIHRAALRKVSWPELPAVPA